MKIEAYNEINAKLNEIKEAANFIPDANTKEGYDKSKRLSLDIGKIKTKLEKVRKTEKEYFLTGGKEVDLQAKLIKSQLEEAQAPHMEAYKAIDNKAKIEKERRINQAQQKIDAVTGLIEKAQFANSKEISDFFQAADDMDTESGFYELTSEAIMAKARVLKTLSTIYQEKKQAEQNAAELEELRKLKAEQEQKERDERIKREAAQKAEAEAKAAIEREEQAKRDKLAAEQAQLEAEKRAIEQEKQAKIDAENAKAKAEQDSKEAAEQARLAEVARQEQAAKAEAERLAQLEANKNHVAKIRGQIKDDLIKCGLDEETAKAVTMALCKKDIRNTQVNY